MHLGWPDDGQYDAYRQRYIDEPTADLDTLPAGARCQCGQPAQIVTDHRMILDIDASGPIWGKWHTDRPQCRKCMRERELVDEWQHRIVATLPA